MDQGLKTVGGVIDVGSQNQVFIDNRFIHSADGIETVVHSPRKTDELTILADRPWEHQLCGYNTILYFGGEYHLWYAAIVKDKGTNAVAYARSSDGVTWEKPDLGLTRELSNSKNNIVLGFGAAGVSGGIPDGLMVFEDPKAPENTRFCMLVRLSSQTGLDLFTSSDGIEWHSEKIVVLDDLRQYKEDGEDAVFIGKEFHLDSQNIVFWDEKSNSYIAYVRRNFERDGQFRTIARGESVDLLHFSHPRDMLVILQPDGVDPTVKLDSNGKTISVMDFYTNAVVKYPWAQDAYYMFPSVYFKYDGWFVEAYGEEPLNCGVLDIRFCASRDGIAWNRFTRRPFVPLGRKGSFDSASIYMVQGIVPGGNGDLYMYYLGSDINHGWGRQDRHQERNDRILTNAGLAPVSNTHAISRLVIRQDGFVSIRGSYTGGQFTTPPLKFSGDRIILNADTSALGKIGVEILDIEGFPIPGFAAGDCLPVHSINDIAIPICWKGGKTLEKLADQAVKLRFYIRDADLFSFRFAGK